MQHTKALYMQITFLLLGFSGFSQSLTSRSLWVSKPVVVDGRADEWEKPLNFYESKTKLMFALANDSNTIYICLRSPEESNQVKISRGGLFVNLSYKSKEKHVVSVNYPLGSGGPMHSDDQKRIGRRGQA